MDRHDPVFSQQLAAVRIEVGTVKHRAGGVVVIQIHMQKIDATPVLLFLYLVRRVGLHWISYCPSRPERPLIIKIFKRPDFADDILRGRKLIQKIEAELPSQIKSFIF